MDSQRIKYFLSVAKHLSFSKAAQEQYVSQSTITTQVQNYEESIGIKLFSRNSKKVELTEAGKQLQHDLTVLDESYNLSIRKAKEIALKERKIISFGCTRPVDWLSVPSVIRKYHSDHSDVEINVTTEHFSRLTGKLISGALDIIFADINYVRHFSQILYFHLYTDHIVAILPTDYPIAPGDALDPEALSKSKIYMMDYVDSSKDVAISAFDAALSERGIDPQRMIRVSSREEIINAVSCGFGLGLMPKTIIGPGSEYITCREIKMSPITCEFVCAYLKDNPNMELLIPFLDSIESFYLNSFTG